MWSTGCIFGELLRKMSDYQPTNPINDLPKNYQYVLFQGSSCFPLSPCNQMRSGNNGDNLIIEEDDQFKKIIETLGPLSETEMSFIDDINMKGYMSSL